MNSLVKVIINHHIFFIISCSGGDIWGRDASLGGWRFCFPQWSSFNLMTTKEAMVAKPAIKLYNPVPQPVRAMQYKDAYRKEFLDKIPHNYWVMNSMRTLRIRVGTEWFGISEDEWLIMGENNDPLDIMSNTKFRRIYQV